MSREYKRTHAEKFLENHPEYEDVIVNLKMKVFNQLQSDGAISGDGDAPDFDWLLTDVIKEMCEICP